MSFLSDLGKKITSQDTASLAVADLNQATADYLRNTASGQGVQTSDKGSNTILVLAVVGSLVVAGGVAFFMLRKK